MSSLNQKANEYPCDETKIYTPRSALQLHSDIHVQNLYDHAPVRIYEKPIKHSGDISKNNDMG